MLAGVSSKVRLRKWDVGDAARLAQLADNWHIAQYMTDAFPHPYTLSDAERFIAFAVSHDPVRIFAIEYDGGVVGGVGLHPQPDISRKNAELGYWIAEPFWGKGIASEAVREIVARGFDLLDVIRIFARPFGDNLPSQKVLQKCGFELEAVIKDGFYKNGRYVDELIYAVRR